MSFTCPRCGMTSHHPEDERHGYCGNCHDFTGTGTALAELQLWFELRRAADQMAVAKWRAAHPNASELFIPEHADLVIWMLDQLASRPYSAQDIATAESEAFERGHQSGRLYAEIKRWHDSHPELQPLPNTCPHCKRDDGTHDDWCRYFTPPEIAARLDRVDARLAKRVGDMINRDAAIRVKLADWLDHYPLDIFPEPDLKKARELLETGGITLDAISASTSRHVLKRLIKLMDDSPDMTA